MNNELIPIRKLFLSRTPIDKIFDFLEEKTDKNYNFEVQDTIYKLTLNDKIYKEYPLPQAYVKNFLKELISRIESSRNIVNEDIYFEYTSLLSQKNTEEFYYVTYEVNDLEFTFKQSDQIVADGTTGFKCWEGGMQLFEQIYANKKLFKNKRIVELGSGIGLTGILISALCDIENYTFTDHHEKVLELIKENLEINGFNQKQINDKKSNKFYQFSDEEGNTNAKYYEEEEDFDRFQIFNTGSSFIRSGPMELKSSKQNDEFESNFEFKSKNENYFNEMNDLKNKETSEDKNNLNLNKRSENLNKKIENFGEKLTNFEEFLKNFEKKLSFLDENVNKLNENKVKIKKNITNLKFKNKNVSVCDLDWFSSNDELIDKLNKYEPDYLIGADIIYDTSIISDLIRLIKIAVVNLDCNVFIVCTLRNEETIKNFELKLRELQKEEDCVKIQRNKLSAKLTFFKNIKLTQPFVLYNIQNE